MISCHSEKRSDEESHGVQDEILHFVQNDKYLQYAVDYYRIVEKLGSSDLSRRT